MVVTVDAEVVAVDGVSALMAFAVRFGVLARVLGLTVLALVECYGYLLLVVVEKEHVEAASVSFDLVFAVLMDAGPGCCLLVAVEVMEFFVEALVVVLARSALVPMS